MSESEQITALASRLEELSGLVAELADRVATVMVQQLARIELLEDVLDDLMGDACDGTERRVNLPAPKLPTHLPPGMQWAWPPTWPPSTTENP